MRNFCIYSKGEGQMIRGLSACSAPVRELLKLRKHLKGH
jgi:hypothetical protein